MGVPPSQPRAIEPNDGISTADSGTRTSWPLQNVRGRRRRLGWHMLRHTFASHLIMKGVPLRAVQDLLGHASMDMTLRYVHLAPAFTAAAVETLDV